MKIRNEYGDVGEYRMLSDMVRVFVVEGKDREIIFSSPLLRYIAQELDNKNDLEVISYKRGYKEGYKKALENYHANMPKPGEEMDYGT